MFGRVLRGVEGAAVVASRAALEGAAGSSPAVRRSP